MIEPVLYIGAAQSVFAGIIIAIKRPQLIADRFLSAWLFIVGIEMFLVLLNVKWLYMVPYQLPFLVIPMLYGPLLWGYVRGLILENPGFRRIEIIHFAPFLLLLIIAFFFRDPDKIVTPEPFSQEYPSWFARSIYDILVFSSMTIYSILVFIALTKHKNRIREQFSYKSGKITLAWLLFFSITVYASFCLSYLLKGINWLIIDIQFDPKIFIYIGLTLISFAFSFYGYRQAGIFHYPGAAKEPVSSPGQTAQYQKSGLSKTELQKLANSISEAMENKQLYLNPEITLSEVSQQLHIPKHHLTQALNSVLHKNFYQFINEYRVKAVITRLEKQDIQRYTLITIAYDSGFNSKSTFNSVFKKITDQTPSAYLKKVKA
ncbi:MAG: helix-turn-helix transcriptional regulator [Bacteroidales bacterium]|nr:helix-turn-helix transcriptional regulator [Bacteroidales bacterium]